MSVCFHNLYLYCPLVASFRHNDLVSFTKQLAYKTPGLNWGYCSSNTYRTLSYFKNCCTRMLVLRSAQMHRHLGKFLVVFVLRMIFWSVSAAASFRIRCRGGFEDCRNIRIVRWNAVIFWEVQRSTIQDKLGEDVRLLRPQRCQHSLRSPPPICWHHT